MFYCFTFTFLSYSAELDFVLEDLSHQLGLVLESNKESQHWTEEIKRPRTQTLAQRCKSKGTLVKYERNERHERRRVKYKRSRF
jgi:hypothetical protein